MATTQKPATETGRLARHTDYRNPRPAQYEESRRRALDCDLRTTQEMPALTMAEVVDGQ